MSKNIFIAALVILNAFLVFRLFQIRTPGAATSHKIETSPAKDEAYINLLKGKILMQARYRPVSVKLNGTVVDTSGQGKTLIDLIDTGGTVVFYFSSRHCYSCIDMAVPKLERLAKSIGLNKVILLAELENKRDIVSYKSKYNSALAFYYSDKDIIESEAKSYTHPFVFILDKAGKTGNPFFVESALPDVTDDFLKEIEKYYQSKKSS